MQLEMMFDGGEDSVVGSNDGSGNLPADDGEEGFETTRALLVGLAEKDLLAFYREAVRHNITDIDDLSGAMLGAFEHQYLEGMRLAKKQDKQTEIASAHSAISSPVVRRRQPAQQAGVVQPVQIDYNALARVAVYGFSPLIIGENISIREIRKKFAKFRQLGYRVPAYSGLSYGESVRLFNHIKTEVVAHADPSVVRETRECAQRDNRSYPI